MLIQLRSNECLLEPEDFNSRHHVILLTTPQQKRPISQSLQLVRDFQFTQPHNDTVELHLLRRELSE